MMIDKLSLQCHCILQFPRFHYTMAFVQLYDKGFCVIILLTFHHTVMFISDQHLRVLELLNVDALCIMLLVCHYARLFVYL